MRQTLKQQIESANRAYIINLRPDSRGQRDYYAVYLQNGSEELEVLWPQNTDTWKKEAEEAELWSMRYSSRKSLPAFHFSLNGYGYSKTHDIACNLRKVNPKIQVFTMGTGHSPSPVSL